MRKASWFSLLCLMWCLLSRCYYNCSIYCFNTRLQYSKLNVDCKQLSPSATMVKDCLWYCDKSWDTMVKGCLWYDYKSWATMVKSCLWYGDKSWATMVKGCQHGFTILVSFINECFHGNINTQRIQKCKLCKQSAVVVQIFREVKE